MFNITKILKGLLIQEESSLTPKEIEINPAGTAGTKTTIVSSQTANITITVPDATDTLVGKATTDTFTNKTFVAAGSGNLITTAASGNLTAVELNAALAELQTDIDTRATSTALSDHLSDAADAHDASAISSVAAGNLAATDVQAALNELQSDIDTRALSSALTDHLNDATDAHDASAISFVAVGTIAATDTQTAIAEVATDAATALSNHEADTTSIHGIADTSLLVTTTGTQVLTNKDIDGGVAANTRRLTVPSAAKATLDGLTRKEGTIVYATDTDKLYADDGTNLVQIGSGAGVINFVTNPDAEIGTTGWTVDSFAAASRPDGALTGTTTGITFATSATAPLAGTNSFTFAKDAANRQGRVVYTGLTFTPAYFARVMNITVDMILSSGTFVAGTNTTDSDLIWYIQNVTDGTFIEPSSFKILSNSTTNSFQFNGTFQTAASATSYRLLLYVASTSASAYTMKFDNVVVTPSTYAYGTPITDWQAFTPIGTWVTNTTYSGYWRRVGDQLEVTQQLLLAGAPTATTLTTNLPFGLSIDVNKLAGGANSDVLLGLANILDAGSINYLPYPIKLFSATTVGPYVVDDGPNGIIASNIVNATTPITFGNLDTVTMSYKVPIVGWSSSVLVSSETDTRVVTATYSTGAGTSIGTGVVILDYDTKVADTHGAVTVGASWKFTCPVSGYYTINGSSRFTTAARRMDLYKNGTFYAVMNEVGVDVTTSISAGLYLNQGDYIDFRANSGSTSALFGDARFNQLTITRTSGPNQIAASESVNCVYTTAASQSIPNNTITIVDFGTKEFDSHGAVTVGASWVFRAPLSGTYEVGGMTMFTSGGWAVGEAVETRILKNGATNAGSLYYQNMIAAHGQIVSMPFATRQVKLLAGETLSFQVYQNSGGDLALFGADNYNYISIKRVGN